MKFEWDSNKEKINIRKHGISFKEAITVFEDYESLEVYDDIHSKNGEERFIIIGKTSSINVVCVVYVSLDDDLKRIISARPATKREREVYYEQNYVFRRS